MAMMARLPESAIPPLGGSAIPSPIDGEVPPSGDPVPPPEIIVPMPIIHLTKPPLVDDRGSIGGFETTNP